MRTESGSNESLKPAPVKSSFQNINLGNQLLSNGQGGQSFDQIFSLQTAGRTPSDNPNLRDDTSAASKKANSQTESGNSLPAENRQHRLEKHQKTKQAQADRQEKAALQHKRQKKADADDARTEASLAAKDAKAADHAAKVAAQEKNAQVETNAAEDKAAGGESVVAPSETAETENADLSGPGLASESSDNMTDGENTAVDTDQQAGADESVGDIAGDTDLVAQQKLAISGDEPDSDGSADPEASDAATLIEEVLASTQGQLQVTEGDVVATDDSVKVATTTNAAAPAVVSQTDTAKHVNSNPAAEQATQAATTDKNSQTAATSLVMNTNTSGDKADASAATAQENAESDVADLFNKAGDKFTDALELSKSDVSKKSATNNDAAIASPVQERLAALAKSLEKSLEKPAKGGESPFQRKSTEAVDATKGSSFQRNVDQLSRLQSNAAKPLSATISTPMNQKEWAGEMGQKLMMMVSSKIQSAQIQVTPGDMGPIDVKVSMQKDHAHVVFTSHVPQTREVLEQALPKLREMLDQNGIAMGNADVRDQGTHQSGQRSGHEQQQHGRGGEQNDSVAAVDAGAERVSVQQVGIVDYYA